MNNTHTPSQTPSANPELAQAFGMEMTPEQARDAIMALVGDMDQVASNAMSGMGLDARVVSLLQLAPNAIDLNSFKRKLGFTLAEHACFVAESDPEQAAHMLHKAANILGPRLPSQQLISMHNDGHVYDRAILRALRYAAKKSKNPSEIAERALEISRELDKDHPQSGKKEKNSSIFGLIDDMEEASTELAKSVAELAAEKALHKSAEQGEVLPLTGITSVDIDFDTLAAPGAKFLEKLSTRSPEASKPDASSRPSPFAIPTLTPPTPYDR